MIIVTRSSELFNFHFSFHFTLSRYKPLMDLSQTLFVVFNLHISLSNSIIVYFLFIFFNIARLLRVCIYASSSPFSFSKHSFLFFFGLIVLYISWNYNPLIFVKKLSFINIVEIVMLKKTTMVEIVMLKKESKLVF